MLHIRDIVKLIIFPTRNLPPPDPHPGDDIVLAELEMLRHPSMPTYLMRGLVLPPGTKDPWKERGHAKYFAVELPLPYNTMGQPFQIRPFTLRDFRAIIDSMGRALEVEYREVPGA